MGANAQWQQRRIPDTMSPDERRWAQSVHDTFDEIYGKWGRLGEKELAEGGVTSTKLARNSVDSMHIVDAAIESAKIRELAVLNGHLANASVDSAKIVDAAITSAKIEEAAIVSAHIYDGAIERAKIAYGAVGNAEIEDLSVGTSKIQVGAITTALIEEGAVGTLQIAHGSITDAHIVELTANKITAGQLSVERLIITGSEQSVVYAINSANGTPQLSVDTIDGDSLTPRTITADKIVAESITSAELASESVIANKIAAGAVTADKIAANSVDATHIQAGSIETDHLAPQFGTQLVIADNPSILSNASAIENEVARATAVEDVIKGFTDPARGFFVFDLENAEMTIGKVDSPFRSVFSNVKLSFKQQGVEVAYISNNKLYIRIAQVLEMLTIGELPVSQGGEGFVDITTRNGGQTGIWRAG